ncbi:hypothetical protein BXP70_07785 [Hymenobacter crusticola]|uniref:Uncharacterized protein n=1 Tax=Hymenobacter crusticola TaxID=1770526 RepID=A0A243WGL7_9BACT|nr:hypothetical protein BXP70_07785 [Hymenobacter crusticola]
MTFLFLLNSRIYAQGTPATLDEQNGFLGATFEREWNTFQHLTSLNCSPVEGADVSCYTGSIEGLTLGTTTLQTIQYTFYKNSLAAITVTLKGTKNIAAFCQSLQEVYGPGTHSAEAPTEVEWNGERVHMAYNLVQGETKYEPVLRLVVRSKAQMTRYQAAQLEARRATTQQSLD